MDTNTPNKRALRRPPIYIRNRQVQTIPLPISFHSRPLPPLISSFDPSAHACSAHLNGATTSRVYSFRVRQLQSNRHFIPPFSKRFIAHSQGMWDWISYFVVARPFPKASRNVDLLPHRETRFALLRLESGEDLPRFNGRRQCHDQRLHLQLYTMSRSDPFVLFVIDQMRRGSCDVDRSGGTSRLFLMPGVLPSFNEFTPSPHLQCLKLKATSSALPSSSVAHDFTFPKLPFRCLS